MTETVAPVPGQSTGDPQVDGFVHLHTHTEYSLLDGASRIGPLVEAAAALGQPAIAVTDHGVLSGAIELTKAAKDAGIKPIIGCEAYMAQRGHGDKETREDRDPYHLVLLARDHTGYRNLVKLLTRAHLDGYYQKPRIDKDLLRAHAQGLIGLSACIGGELPQAILTGNMDIAERIAREHAEIFGDGNFFLELHDHSIAEESVIRTGLVEIARRTGLPMVATNDSHYIQREDAQAHDILLCMQTGAKRSDEKRFRFSGPHYYMASGAEMRSRFASYPTEAITNTLAIAQEIDTLNLTAPEPILPTFEWIPAGMDSNQYLRHLSVQGLERRFSGAPVPDAYVRQLTHELDVIRDTGYPDYFLIVSDFISAARDRGIRVGPGRGSAAGSLVSYATGITNIDPIRYGLIFERFLSRERKAMPDIDVDFDDRRRGEVLEYVREKYGASRVAQTATFSTMAARAAVRDVGRVLDVPLAQVDHLAKLIPGGAGVTLDASLDPTRPSTQPLRDLIDAEAWANDIITAAKTLEGVKRTLGTHASAVVIAAQSVDETVPLMRSGDTVITQFDGKGNELAGLLKVDFLGLGNLSVMDECLTLVQSLHGHTIDMDRIPLDDPKAYELFQRSDTWGIFQSEGSGAKQIYAEMLPRSIDDLSVAVALNRPGPLETGAKQRYMEARCGDRTPSYVFPDLEPILGETYGEMIYQEQIMKIAQVLAGYSMGESDGLRAAMGKKDKVKMEAEASKFLARASARGHDPAAITTLLDDIKVFAKYCFNKSHSACYGTIAYQTAYLKANYPVEYLSALMNYKANQDLENLALTIADAKQRGIEVGLPDVNRSQERFAPAGGGQRAILFGLSGVKNVGSNAHGIIAAREKDGSFTDLFNLCLRTPRTNRRALESLISAGACDSLGERAALLDGLERAMSAAARVRSDLSSGQESLFDLLGGEAPPAFTLGNVPPMADVERRANEREFLGLFISSHPIDDVLATVLEKSEAGLHDLGDYASGDLVQVAGMISGLRTWVPKTSRDGKPMAAVTIEDRLGQVEVTVFARTYERHRTALAQDAVVIVRGKIEKSSTAGVDGPDEEHQETVKILADSIFAIDDPSVAAPLNNRARRAETLERIVDAFDDDRDAVPVIGVGAPDDPGHTRYATDPPLTVIDGGHGAVGTHDGADGATSASVQPISPPTWRSRCADAPVSADGHEIVALAEDHPEEAMDADGVTPTAALVLQMDERLVESVGKLRIILLHHRGTTPVVVSVMRGDREISTVDLPAHYSVTPGPDLSSYLDALLGEGRHRLDQAIDRIPAPVTRVPMARSARTLRS